MASCTLNYLNQTNLPLVEKERLTELHQEIFAELKQSKYIRQLNGELVLHKNGFSAQWAALDIRKINDRLGVKAVSLLLNTKDGYFKAIIDVLKTVTSSQIDNNFELKENKEAFGKQSHPEDANSYDIFYKGKKIGKVALFDTGENSMIKGVELHESERNKGLGKALYKWLNYKASLKGGVLYGDQENISLSAQRVWESLSKEGLVDIGNTPKFIKQKIIIPNLDIYSQQGNQYNLAGEVFPTYGDALSYKEKLEEEYIQMEKNRLFESGELQINCNL